MKTLFSTLTNLGSRCRTAAKDVRTPRDPGRNLSAIVALTLAALSLPAHTAAQSYPLGSNANYTLINNCQSVNGLTVSLKVTQDMLALVTGGYYNVNQPNGGFALQLNAALPPTLLSNGSNMESSSKKVRRWVSRSIGIRPGSTSITNRSF